MIHALFIKYVEFLVPGQSQIRLSKSFEPDISSVLNNSLKSVFQ